MKTVRFEIVAHVKGENILSAYHDLCTLFANNKAEVLIVKHVSKTDTATKSRIKSVDLDSL